MPVSDAENRLSLMYVAGILPHAKALFDATSIESNSPSRPVLAKIYAFFLTYCVEILGCDHNVAFLCSDTLSAGTDDIFPLRLQETLLLTSHVGTDIVFILQIEQMILPKMKICLFFSLSLFRICKAFTPSFLRLSF